MTYEELKEIKQRLDKWREQRHLSYESQQKGFIPNILDELREYYLAKDDDERVAELCDIVIYCLNVNELKEFSLNKQPISLTYLISNLGLIINKHYAGLKLDFERELTKSCINGLIDISIHLIKQIGYNPYECLKEKVKEIESRTGHYDESLGKFIKDIGAYSLKAAKELAEEQCFKKIGYVTLALPSFEKNKGYFCFDFAWRKYGKNKRYTEKIKKWHKAKMIKNA